MSPFLDFVITAIPLGVTFLFGCVGEILTEKAAKDGVVITNTSATEPIVMLKHFSENPELDRFMAENK